MASRALVAVQRGAIRTIAPAKLPREWVDECARFADDEFSRSSHLLRQRAEKK